MAPISRNIGFVLIGVYLVVLIVGSFKLLKLNYAASVKNSKLEADMLETQVEMKQQELNYLKMQIHPHFLFNTLNTLYGYSLKKSDQTPEMILKLSGLLDYILYQSDKTSVLLSDEINHILDYIDLEKMRFGEDLMIDFKTINLHPNFRIAPMILLPFVENSFKHSGIINGVRDVSIRVEIINETMIFKVKNTKTPNKLRSEGIGLRNLNKRLNLLYPEKYTLDIVENVDSFKIKLILRSELEKL